MPHAARSPTEAASRFHVSEQFFGPAAFGRMVCEKIVFHRNAKEALFLLFLRPQAVCHGAGLFGALAPMPRVVEKISHA